MKLTKEHIQVLKELYDNALAAAYVQASEEASRKYGLPIAKLPAELVRGIAASNPSVKDRLNAWEVAAENAHEEIPSDTWQADMMPGYQKADGGAATIADVCLIVNERLEQARHIIKTLTVDIHNKDIHTRGFWLSSVMETATLVRVECGETLMILNDISLASREKKNDYIKTKQEEARILRDDAKIIIDLAKAKQGY